MRNISKIVNFFAATMLIGAFAFVAVACGQESAPTQAPEPAELATSDVSPVLPEDVAVEVFPEAPDFTLPAANKGTNITLSDFQGEKPVVLVFYRAFW